MPTKAILITVLCISLSSCDMLKPVVKPQTSFSSKTIFEQWIHTPLHPQNNQPVTFFLDAKDEVGLSRVELHIFEYELYRNGDGLPSKRKRDNGEWGLVKTWNFESDRTEAKISYTFRKGFKASSNVEYIFKVVNNNNQYADRLAIFDAGTSPWPQDKILLYSTSRDPLQNTLNICFFPDTDYNTNWNDFLSDSENLIFNGYHQNNKIQEKKDKWNFFYTKQEADGFAIYKDPFNESNFPQFLKDQSITGVDAFGLIHKNEYSDGAYLSGNFSFLAYNMFTSEGYNIGTAVHETAHAVFNLSDEYNKCVCFQNPDGGANVFNTFTECKAFNLKHGFTDMPCTKISHRNGSSWFMSERNVLFETEEECKKFNRQNNYDVSQCERHIDVTGEEFYRSLAGLCIMQDDGDDVIRDFQRTCSAVIDECYLNMEDNYLPPVLAANSKMENHFGYEPVVLLELDVHETDYEVAVAGVEYGVPTKNFSKRKDIELKVQNEIGTTRYSISLHNPDAVHFHHEGNNDTFHEKGLGKSLIAIPYTYDLAKVVCKVKDHRSSYWSSKGVSEASSKKEFDIGRQLEIKMKKFEQKK